MKRTTHRSALCVAIVILPLADGCGTNAPSDTYTQPIRISPEEIPLYVVDGYSNQTHFCSGMLENQDRVPRVYVFEGVSCGCLTSEHDHRSLVQGDPIRVKAGQSAEIVLRNKLAYRDGFYTDIAYFRDADDPSYQVLIESRYAVVRRMSLSPGALVFDRIEDDASFAARARVTLRSSSDSPRYHELSISKLPDSVYSQVTQISQRIEKRLSSTSGLYYEDEWDVQFRIAPDASLGPLLPPHGEVEFVVSDRQGKQMVRRLLPYNAASVGKSEN